jgi:predicted ATPase
MAGRRGGGTFRREFLIEARLDGLSGDGYPYDLPVVKSLAERPLAFHPKVTYLVGENGSGKSTLLEAIAVALDFNPEGGTKNFNFATRESHSALHEDIRIWRGRAIHRGFFFRAESFFNVATQIDELGVTEYYGGRSLHERSHGEAFLATARQRFRSEGVYLLDEPEAALSPARQLTALSIIHDAVRDGAQFVIATHSPILMAYPDAWIYACDETGLHRVEYEDTEHVQIARTFLASPARMLHHLLADEE